MRRGVQSMSSIDQQIGEDLQALVAEWVELDYLRKDDLFVIGCSTSEVAGKSIGTSGSDETAAKIFQALQSLQQQSGIHLVFQCCEHLNRALVMERNTLEMYQLEEVTVIPQPDAGGSMASYAYQHLNDPVVAESVKAHAGIDIGETMIGMHLRHVAVPLRFNQRSIGHARLTGARTRPKLIGGARAVYK